MENKYDTTVSADRNESLMKAVELLKSDLAEAEAKKITRPDISTRRILLFKLLRLLTAALCVTAVFAADRLFGLPVWAIWALFAAEAVIAALIFSKRACKEWILLYQKHAPERLRGSCLFTPSCSEYMLLAIDKYGTLRGVTKGLRRLCRCHHPYGGEDYP